MEAPQKYFHSSTRCRQIARLVISAFCLVTAITSTPIFAQTVDIDWVQISGTEVVVHYDLEDDHPLHAYTINLFSSTDNFASPLLKLSGDHGNEVKAGKDKQIRWKITEELGAYGGEIELELRAKMYVPFMKMTAFRAETKYKRGRNYPLVWTSGNLGGHVDIELYFLNTRIHSDRNVPNTGKFDWQLPANVKPSGEYRLKFTNTKNREETFTTQPFRVISKFPLVAKIAASALAGVGIYLLIKGKEAPKTPANPILPSAGDDVGVPGND
jgi:hypothetical protein